MSPGPVAHSDRIFVLVHGAFHGSWCWDRTIEGLAALGHRAVGVELPMDGLLDDAETVRRAIPAADAPVTLVGHSYGGAVIGEAGTHPAVDQLVFLTARVLRRGDAVADPPTPELHLGEGYGYPELVAAMIRTPTGLELDPGAIDEVFYHDCSPADRELAAARLRPVGIRCQVDRTTQAAWESKPSAYIVCTDDRGLRVSTQVALAARLGVRPYLLAGSSHSPFLSRPQETAELLVRISHDLGRG